MGTCLKLGMVTLTMVTFTTKISAAQDPSADDVEALKKQNAEQQQRLEKLSGELDRIKKLLEEKGISARGQSSGEKPLTSGLSVALYGYIKLDAAYDSSRILATLNSTRHTIRRASPPATLPAGSSRSKSGATTTSSTSRPTRRGWVCV